MEKIIYYFSETGGSLNLTMKNFQRNDLLFSLCGLNCALCPMNINQYCPGCGGGEGNQSCSIAKCSLQHDKVQYCFQCTNYPCDKYSKIDEYDSFITHQNQKQDMNKFSKLGVKSYSAEQQKKRTLLNHLLEHYNDGRKKTLFCVAVNLLALEDLESIVIKLDNSNPCLTLKEKSALAANLFHETAAQKKIVLKLRRKKSAN